jgi:hypothetical protein
MASEGGQTKGRSSVLQTCRCGCLLTREEKAPRAGESMADALQELRSYRASNQEIARNGAGTSGRH